MNNILKVVCGTLAGIMIGGLTIAGANQTIQAIQNTEIKVSLNGQVQAFKDEITGEIQYPITYHDRTYLPLRNVAQLAGLDVDYDEKNLTAILKSKDNDSIQCFLVAPLNLNNAQAGEIKTKMFEDNAYITSKYYDNINSKYFKVFSKNNYEGTEKVTLEKYDDGYYDQYVLHYDRNFNGNSKEVLVDSDIDYEVLPRKSVKIQISDDIKEKIYAFKNYTSYEAEKVDFDNDGLFEVIVLLKNNDEVGSSLLIITNEDGSYYQELIKVVNGRWQYGAEPQVVYSLDDIMYLDLDGDDNLEILFDIPYWDHQWIGVLNSKSGKILESKIEIDCSKGP